MQGGSGFLAEVEANLRDFGMRVSEYVKLPGGPIAELFGSRTYISWKGLVIVSQHIAVCDYGDRVVTPEEAKSLFDTAFRQAKKVNWVPLLRGMQFGYMVIPCLVVKSADSALVKYAKGSPRKHWSLFEFPVVVDRTTGRTHYYNQTDMWGAFFFSDLRRLVKQCIVPAVSPTDQENGFGSQ